MGLIVTVIIAKFVLAVIFAILLWFWQTIIGFISFFAQLASKYFGSAWGIVLLVFTGFFIGAIIAQQFQEPVWQTVDASYTVIVQPPAQLSLSFANSGPRPFYEWTVTRWNDIVYGFGDAFRALVNDLSSLPSPLITTFYTGIPRAFFRFVERVGFLFFDTPSWQIPFGISSLMSSFFRTNFCIFNLVMEFILRTVDFTLIRNDIQFCEFDPNATCILRQVPNTFPFLFLNHVEETIIGEENCTLGREIDCEFIACNVRAFANFSAPFSNIPGAPDLPAFYEELIPDICCFVTRSYKAPLWLLQGLLSWCINIGDAPDFIINEWLSPAGQCFIDFFFKLSGETIVNIFVDIFAIIFPFIQIVIDSVVDLVACYSIFGGCYNSYPGNCAVDPFTAFATAGIHTCFEMSGECIVNGNEANDIPPNEIFGVVPLNFVFQTLIPFVFQIFDSGFCNFFIFHDCLFSGTHFCFGSGTILFLCQLNCLQTVPIIRPVVTSFAQSYANIIAAISTIINGVNEFIEIVNTFCSQIDSISISGVGFPGCHVNPIVIPGGLMREDKNGPNQFYEKENNGNNSSSRFDDYFKDILGDSKFSNFTQLLEIKNVNPNTTCGRILFEVAINYDEHGNDIFSDTDPGLFSSFWICNYLFLSGMKNEKKYDGMVKMENFLDISTVFNEFSALFDCKHKEFLLEMEKTTNSSFQSSQEELFTKISDGIQKFFRIDEFEKQASLSNIDLKNETALQIWGDKVRASHVDSIRTIGFGVMERVLQNEFVKSTLTSIQVFNLYSDVLLKLTGKIPGSLFNHNSRRKRIGGGSSLSSLQRYYHNYTIGDLIPENDYSLNLMNEKLALIQEEYEKSSALGKSSIERKLVSGRDEVVAEFVTYAANYLQAIFDERKMKGVIRNQISSHNRKRFGFHRWDNLLEDTHKTRVITVEHLKSRREVVMGKITSIREFLDDIFELGEYFFPDKQAIADIMKWPVLNEIGFVPSIHMFLNHDFKNPEFVNNYTKYQTGKLSYIIEKGFVEPSEYELYRKETRTTLGLIRQWWTGEYNITRDRYKPQNTSLFGMDYTAPSKYLTAGKSLWRLLVKEQRYKMMESRGIAFDSEEAKVFKISVGLPSELVTIIKFLEYLINTVIGTIMRLLFDVHFNFNLEKFLCDWIDSFDAQDETVDAATNTFDFFKRLFICKIPENINGEEFYKFFCFPFLPEGLFREWTTPVGSGNPYFPLQLGIWPTELIEKPCVNTFNGQSNFWEGWRISNNCGSMDGQDRPLCGTLNVDWCRRDFTTCSDIGFNSPQQSFAFFTGIFPVWLQEFYTGVVGVVGVSMFMVFIYIHILNFGSLIFAASPWFVLPAVLGHYLILNIFDSLFQGLEGEGERGGIPYGFLYILTLAIISYLAPPSWDSMPQVIRVFIFWGLAVTWLVNLIIPFRGIRTGLTINQWIVIFFEFLDQTPQFFEFINFSSIIDALHQFDFSNKPVPYVDTFCFLATISNFFAFFIAVFLLIDVITFFIYVFYPTLVFLVVLGQAIFQFITDIRYWQVKQRVRTIGEEFDDFKKETKKDFGRLKLNLKKSITQIYGPDSFMSNLIGKVEDEEVEFVLMGNKSKSDDNNNLRKRRRRTIGIRDTMFDIVH